MAKRFSILFAVVLLFQTFANSLFLPQQGLANAAKSSSTEESILQQVTVLDMEGNEVTENTENNTEVQLNLLWSTESLDVELEDRYTIDLPEQILIEEHQEGKLFHDETDVGDYHVSNHGEVIFELNEAIVDYPEATGKVIIDAIYVNEEAEEDDAEKEVAEEEKAEQASEVAEEEDVEEEEGSNDSENVEENKEKDKSEEADKADTVDKTKENKTAKTDEATHETSEEKHGFNLELGEVTDLDGNSYSEEKLLNPQDEFYLNLDWDLADDHHYKAGDTETFDLPNGIKIVENIEVELLDSTGQLVANAVVTPDKKVELTFTNYVETHSDVSGWMQFISTLDEEEVEVEDEEAILEPIEDEGEIRIPLNRENTGKTIEKTATPNKGYNADEINWEVVINKNKTSLKGTKVTDALPEGTVYQEGSLKVTKLKVDLYGHVLEDLEEVEVTPELNENGELVIPLGETNDAYRLEYTTDVTDDGKSKFENNAILKDNELDDVSAKSTATINRGDPIKKTAAKGYDPKTGIIEWEIEFNYNQKDLSDITLKDEWTPEGKLDLVEDSLQFQEVSIDDHGDAHHEGDAINLPENAELVIGEDGFEVSGISTDKAYKATYQTKVKDRVLDSFDVSNTAGFGSESDGDGTSVGTYYGSKSAGTIDYAAKTIDWTIEINHDEWPMENISVEDSLGEGLTLDNESIDITVDGDSYTGDYTLSGDNPFTIEFPDNFITDKKIEISYKTEFDADKVPDHEPTNKADITWTPEGESDSITKEVEAGTKLNWETEQSDWKNGSYNPETKEITWEIITNYRENQMTDLIIQDEPQGNQNIIGDSAEVKELNIAANGDMTEGNVIDDVATIDEASNTLEVNIGETNKAYKIEYKTSLAGLSDIQTEYVNKAVVKDGNKKLSDLDAKVGIAKAHTYGDKSGEQDGKQVHWDVTVNPGQQQVDNLKLEDTVSENQDILRDTFKVYEASVDIDGKATKGDELDADAYELSHSEGDATFTVKWNETVDRAFIVEYSTLFFAGHNDDVTNSYTVTGDNIVENGETEGNGSVTIEQRGSGGAEGTAGYLVIDKVDTTYGQDETKLAGAEFDLIDADTGNVLKSGTTDDNGQIDFGRLLFGDYKLVETKVPEGYVTLEEEQTITIDQEYDGDSEKEDFEYTVENYKPVFAIDLLKTDDENNALADAEFTLFDSEDNEIATETTNEDGEISFVDLEHAGMYYIQEINAPAGYVLDDTKHEVTIGEKEPTPIEITVDNQQRGAVKLTKTDVDTGEPLEGVAFELQKLNEETDEYEPVETYEPFITDEDGVIKTSNTLEAGDYQFVETKGLEGYRNNEESKQFIVNESEVNTKTLTMTNEKYKGSIKLIKLDDATDERLSEAEFNLLDSEGEIVKEGLVTNDQGEILVEDLLLGNYQLIETSAPEGYELDDTPIDVEITEDEEVVEKTMTNHKITDVSVKKYWNNAGGDTEPVTVKLLPTEQTVELNEGNDWQATFNDLRVYDESGGEIDYQVEELEVGGYQSTVTGDQEAGYIITNTEETSVSGEKIWLDDLDEHPSIIVELLANGDKVNEQTVDASSDWTYAFTNLAKYDESGEEITYTVDEVDVDGYETTINDFNITNLRVGTTELSGEKIWLDDESDNRPETITIELLENGEKTGRTTEVSAESDWKYEFTDLDMYDDQGLEIEYTIDEVDVPEGYEKSIEGNDITNLRVGTTDVEVTKNWKDEYESDRPEAIKVNLLQNGEFYEEYEVTKENDWKLTIEDLPQYDETGKAYAYTVKEHDVPGYTSDVDGFDITNTRADTKSIDITKSWLDDESEDRPDSIEVELFRSITAGDQELVDTYTVKADQDWSLEIKDLPAFNNDGKAYMYEIKEKEIDGYETTVNGFELTNLRVGETEVTGTKTWLDDDSKNRPDAITVHLLANGEKIDDTEVTPESNWEYEFTELPRYDDEGKEIAYTVDESDVEGYEKSIDGFDVTNLRVGTTDVDITKRWKDENETNRPDTIKVNLLQNGDFYKEYEVTKENDWKLSISDLPKYDQTGKAYEYSVTEHDVPGYTSQVDGFDITNTRSDMKTIHITKSWLDDDAQNRPDTIEVELYRSIADGDKELVDTLEVTHENDWSLEVKDLPAFDDNGKAYTYEIEEKEVDGYKTTVNGFDITNLRVGKTSLEVNKVWKGDQEDNRPHAISVDLLQNGEVITTVELTADHHWAYEFKDLETYDENGVAYEYTVEEHEVQGYQSTIKETATGFEITNTLEETSEDPHKDSKDPGEDPKNGSGPKGDDSGQSVNGSDESNSKPGGTESDSKGEGKTLPKTATNMFALLLAGILFTAAGVGLIFYRRRKEA